MKPIDPQAASIQWGIEIETRVPDSCGIDVCPYHHGCPVRVALDATSALPLKWLKDGEVLGMANGGKTTIHVGKDGKYKINDANIVASIPVSNGMIHVIDGVLLPPPPAAK